MRRLELEECDDEREVKTRRVLGSDAIYVKEVDKMLGDI